MKQLLFFVAMVTLPLLSFGQDAAYDTAKQVEVITFEALPENVDLQVSVGTFTKNEVNNLSYKKSIELISIKAYRKSLQIKVKEVRTC